MTLKVLLTYIILVKFVKWVFVKIAKVYGYNCVY